jgi:hypothetical protein
MPHDREGIPVEYTSTGVGKGKSEGLGMGKRRYLLALSVPLLLLTAFFSTRTAAATTFGTGSPGLTAWPTFGGPGGDTTSPDCNPFTTCWVILGNPANASASIAWTAAENEEDGSKVTFTPPSGVLAPGQHVKVIIHNQPCDEGGEWDFTGYALSKNVSGYAEAVVRNACG